MAVVSPEWMTAFATSVGAVAGGAAVWLSVLSYRFQVRQRLPSIEPDVSLSYEPGVGRYVHLRLKVSNRFDETLLVSRIAVRRPRGARLSLGRTVQTPRGTNLLPARGDSNSVVVAREISPYGSFWDGPLGRLSTSYAELDLFVCPSENWTPGPLSIEVLISSKASTIRDKRMIVKSRAPVVTAKVTDANANISG